MTATAPVGAERRPNRFLDDIFAQPAALHTVLDQVVAQTAALERGGHLLASADRVVLTSMGSAYHSLVPVAEALDALLPNVRLVETADLLRRPRRPGDAYLVMSRSGESREIRELAGLLGAERAPVVAVTMTPGSSLDRAATVTLHDPAPYDSFICTKAYSTMALTGLLLAAHLAADLDDRLIGALHRTFDDLDRRAPDMLATVEAVPWLGESATFFSRGVASATAFAGTLWLEEAARVRASATTVDAFLHGPVEQVEPGFRGVWIDLEPDPAGRAQREYLRERGASLAGVVTADGQPGDILVPGLDLPPVWRVLGAAMPVQMLAYASARARGLEPGTMRYLGWVVQ